MLTLAPEQKIQGMLFWLMGDLSQAVNPLAGARRTGRNAAGLDALRARTQPAGARRRPGAGARRRGTASAPHRLHRSHPLATAAAVTTAGSIGFVGLIVPHLVRLAIGNDQRLLLPASVLAGGSLLTLADTAARTIVAPIQLPVGVLTALIGVPVFLYLLGRGRT